MLRQGADAQAQAHANGMPSPPHDDHPQKRKREGFACPDPPGQSANDWPTVRFSALWCSQAAQPFYLSRVCSCVPCRLVDNRWSRATLACWRRCSRGGLPPPPRDARAHLYDGKLGNGMSPRRAAARRVCHPCARAKIIFYPSFQLWCVTAAECPPKASPSEMAPGCVVGVSG